MCRYRALAEPVGPHSGRDVTASGGLSLERTPEGTYSAGTVVVVRACRPVKHGCGLGLCSMLSSCDHSREHHEGVQYS